MVVRVYLPYYMAKLPFYLQSLFTSNSRDSKAIGPTWIVILFKPSFSPFYSKCGTKMKLKFISVQKYLAGESSVSETRS